MAKRLRPWLGGYVRSTKGGKPVFVIEKWAGGRRVHVSTRCTLEGPALKELDRFEKDPLNYVPGGDAPGAVRMTDELVLAYADYQRTTKKLSVEWMGEVGRCLVDWMEALGARDLRALDLHRDIKPALVEWPHRRPHRIKAIKGFFRWLRQERGLITRAQDCTMDLPVPQARAEKNKRRKVVPFDDVQATAAKLVQPTRDILHLMTATAWHLSEVKRFSEGGEISTPLNGGALAVLHVRHKNGDIERQTITFAEHLEAAKRLRERGKFPKRMTLARHMHAACDAAGVPRFGLGQIRHSVLTWGVEMGASPEQAAEFAHHKTSTTTRKHYLDLETPKVIPIRRIDS